MPHNADKFFDAIPTRHGVRLIAKPELIDLAWRQDSAVGESMIRQRAEQMSVRTRDAMLPGAGPPPSRRKAFARDDLEDDPSERVIKNDPSVIAELPPPPRDMHYEVEARAEGVYAVVLAEGPPLNGDPTTGDRYRVHRLSYRDGDPLLKKMNRDARRFWRDGNTRDADAERTVAMLDNPGPSGRYELRENPNGTWNVIWISPDDRDDMINGVKPPGADMQSPSFGSRPSTPELLGGNTPPGGSGDGPQIRSGSSAPSRSTGDRRTPWQRLASMNAANRRFWSRGR